MAQQHAQTTKTKEWLTGLEKEEQELRTKVNRLEMYLSNSVPPSIKELQVTESCTQNSYSSASILTLHHAIVAFVGYCFIFEHQSYNH